MDSMDYSTTSGVIHNLYKFRGVQSIQIECPTTGVVDIFIILFWIYKYLTFGIYGRYIISRLKSEILTYGIVGILYNFYIKKS